MHFSEFEIGGVGVSPPPPNQTSSDSSKKEKEKEKKRTEKMTEEEGEEEIREAFMHHTKKIAEEQSTKSGMRISVTVVAAVADVAMSFAGLVARDAELFSKHAKRARISVEDVKLCARRNESLLSQISDFSQSLIDSKPPSKKSAPSSSSPPSAAAAAPPVVASSSSSSTTTTTTTLIPETLIFDDD